MGTKNAKKEEKISKLPKALSGSDYSKDPFFVKKNKRASEVINKYGIPEHFVKKATT